MIRRRFRAGTSGVALCDSDSSDGSEKWAFESVSMTSSTSRNAIGGSDTRLVSEIVTFSTAWRVNAKEELEDDDLGVNSVRLGRLGELVDVEMDASKGGTFKFCTNDSVSLVILFERFREAGTSSRLGLRLGLGLGLFLKAATCLRRGDEAMFKAIYVI